MLFTCKCKVKHRKGSAIGQATRICNKIKIDFQQTGETSRSFLKLTIRSPISNHVCKTQSIAHILEIYTHVLCVSGDEHKGVYVQTAFCSTLAVVAGNFDREGGGRATNTPIHSQTCTHAPIHSAHLQQIHMFIHTRTHLTFKNTKRTSPAAQRKVSLRGPRSGVTAAFLYSQ